MDVQTILLRPTGQLSQQIGNMLLLLDAEVVLGSSKKDDASFTDGDGQVSELVVLIGSVEYVFDLCSWVLSADYRSDIEVF